LGFVEKGILREFLYVNEKEVTKWFSTSGYFAVDLSGFLFDQKTNRSKIKSKVHTLVSNEVLGWTGKAFGASAIHNWYLERIENGTRIRVEESMEGWIINLMKKKMNEKLADDMKYWLEQLKIESEK